MNKPVFNLQHGDYFGENNIYGPDKKIPMAFTTEETVVIQLTKGMVEDSLGEPVKFCILRNYISQGFMNSKHLCDLSDVQTEKVMNVMNCRQFTSQGVLFEKGQPQDGQLVMLLDALQVATTPEA